MITYTPPAGASTPGANVGPRATTPADLGLAAWSYDPQYTANGPSAGVGKPIAALMWVPETTTFTKISILTRAGGTGVTALANCFLAIFSKTGTRLGVTSNLASYWGDAVNGWKFSTLTADATDSLTVEGGPDEYVYGAYLIGTQSTTALTVGADAQQDGKVANVGLLTAAGTAFASGKVPQSFTTSDSGLTAMPTSITMASVLPTAKIWFGALSS